MFGAFKPTGSLLGGLLWLVPFYVVIGFSTSLGHT